MAPFAHWVQVDTGLQVEQPVPHFWHVLPTWRYPDWQTQVLLLADSVHPAPSLHSLQNG